MNSFLKKPKILEKEQKFRELGMELDPEQYPKLLMKDEAMAEHSRFRTVENEMVDKWAATPNSGDENEEDLFEGAKRGSYMRDYTKVFDGMKKRLNKDKDRGDYEYIEPAMIRKDLEAVKASYR